MYFTFALAMAAPAWAMARPANYLEPNATSSAAATGNPVTVSANTTGFPSTSTKFLTTTVTAVSHPPGTLLSLVSMITTRSETTYIPGPVTVYPGTITETMISTGTVEHRRTSYNGKTTTLHAQSTATWFVTSTVTDPNPPPPDTSDFTFPYPFMTDNPTDTTTDGGTETTTTDTAVVTPPPTATPTAAKPS